MVRSVKEKPHLVALQQYASGGNDGGQGEANWGALTWLSTRQWVNLSRPLRQNYQCLQWRGYRGEGADNIGHKSRL